jgi:hypothetical protein
MSELHMTNKRLGHRRVLRPSWHLLLDIRNTYYTNT